jgi:hypothetical protein
MKALICCWQTSTFAVRGSACSVGVFLVGCSGSLTGVVARLAAEAHVNDEDLLRERFLKTETDNDLPTYRLFKKGAGHPVVFNGKNEDALKRFLKMEAGIVSKLDGCTPELDEIAARFMKADTDADKQGLIEEARATITRLRHSKESYGTAPVLGQCVWLHVVGVR